LVDWLLREPVWWSSGLLWPTAPGTAYYSHPAVPWGCCSSFSAELTPEGVGVRGIGKAVAHIVLLVVVPSAATTRFDAALAVEGEDVV
jgi:hypothetical protein